jgi:uncharacterized protein with von Willebrand factor type A (vWA) domain
VPKQISTDRDSIVSLLARFGRELRAAGIAVGSGDIISYCASMTQLDPGDLVDVYWAGRCVLVSRRDDIATYDRVFRRFFLGEEDPVAEVLRLNAEATSQDSQSAMVVPANEPGPDEEREETVLGLMASGAETLRHKAFAACTPDELAALRRIMARIRLTPPRRRTRRTAHARRGSAIDLRRMVRQSMRMHGEPAELYWRDRKLRLRPLILILDVSGSMADYSRNLLQFAYSARRAAAKVEVFCSDGLDRGDPGVLSGAMERLSRLSYRIVWLNPHKGNDPGFRPSTLGMMVAAPHVDLLLSGHDLSSLEEFATVLPTLN